MEDLLIKVFSFARSLTATRRMLVVKSSVAESVVSFHSGKASHFNFGEAFSFELVSVNFCVFATRMRGVSISTLIICIRSALLLSGSGEMKEKPITMCSMKKASGRNTRCRIKISILLAGIYLSCTFIMTWKTFLDVHFADWILEHSLIHTCDSIFPRENLMTCEKILVSLLKSTQTFRNRRAWKRFSLFGRLLIFRFRCFKNLKQTLEILLFHGSRDPKNLNRLSWMVNCVWYVNPWSLLPRFPWIPQVNSNLKLALLWMLVIRDSLVGNALSFYKFSN